MLQLTFMLIKYLAYLKSTNRNKGFTLIELLVVIIIISTLSAIALPNFLNQASKGKQAEAKLALGNINRAQITYRMESNSFASSMDKLALGLPTETRNYKYEISAEENKAIAIATAKDTAVKGYSAGTVMYTDKTGQSQAASVICETKNPSTVKPESPVLQTSANVPEVAASCVEGMEKL